MTSESSGATPAARNASAFPGSTPGRGNAGDSSGSAPATGNTIDAFHLPGLREEDVERWAVREFGGGVAFRTPVLRAGALLRIADAIATARDAHLIGASPRALTRSIGLAAARIADPDDDPGSIARRALPQITGLSPAMTDLVIERIARDWTSDALMQLLEQEFPRGIFEPFADDRMRRPRPRVVGPRLAFHIFSGNVPGVSVTSLIRSLLVRAGTLGKNAAREPLLSVLFARALESVDPALASCIAVTWWQGGDAGIEDEAMRHADTIVVYGGAHAIRSVRSRAPVAARIVEHGPRASVALVARTALRSAGTAAAAAAKAAWAIAVFDQQGCVSPHVIWVEAAADAVRAFARTLGTALDRVEHELPRGAIDAGESAAIRDARATAEFRAIRGEPTGVFAGEGTSWTVLFDGDPAFQPSCLNRTIHVKPVDSLERVPPLLAPLRGFIQTAAIEGAGARTASLADALAAVGVTRITDLRRMPWPPPGWHHDGAGPLRELCRWVDLEA